VVSASAEYLVIGYLMRRNILAYIGAGVAAGKIVC
jgi:hypothetical protein